MALSMALGGGADSAKADGTEISLTPRVWYNFMSTSIMGDNHADYSNGASEAAAQTAYELPFYGGTVTLKNPQLFGPGTLAVTVLNGDAHNRFSGIYTSPTGTVVYDGEGEAHRFDAETLYILPVQSNTNIFMGARYIGFDWSHNLHNRADPTLTADWTSSENAYYAEFGVGLSAPLSENKRHVLFANLVGLAGISKYDVKTRDGSASASLWTGGIDANVGYAYQMTQDVKFSARYRLFARGELDHWSSQGSEIMHGPEVGMTYTIGRGPDPLK
jgi:hypothetical protein